MSQDLEVLPGLELVLRLVAGELEAMTCRSCGGPLSDSKIMLREHDLRQIVIEVACRACGEAVLLSVQPQAEDGKAGVR